MRNIFFLTFIMLCTSCNLVKVNPVTNLRGFYSYHDATQRDYPGLLVKADASTPLCELEYREGSNVYVINGQQLKQCLAEYDDAIIYIWDAHCTGKECYSPSVLQRYCDQKNVELFVIAEYYDGEELVQYYEINRPIFGIDTNFYKTDFIEKYTKRFETDLTGEEDTVGRMLYFQKGNYMGKAKIEFEK